MPIIRTFTNSSEGPPSYEDSVPTPEQSTESNERRWCIPRENNAAPYWPYLSALLATILSGCNLGLTRHLNHSLGKRHAETLVVWLWVPALWLAAAHLGAWVWYTLNDISTTKAYTFPSIWCCYLTLCAFLNMIICIAFAPTGLHEDTDVERQFRTW
ncbi:hypothetical protein LTR27_009487 [Elasticomyces elasticus]|nr:hypothetical protein LTR27_009487 [Elasticomyces elasticus]